MLISLFIILISSTIHIQARQGPKIELFELVDTQSHGLAIRPVDLGGQAIELEPMIGKSRPSSSNRNVFKNIQMFLNGRPREPNHNVGPTIVELAPASAEYYGFVDKTRSDDNIYSKDSDVLRLLQSLKNQISQDIIQRRLTYNEDRTAPPRHIINYDKDSEEK